MNLTYAVPAFAIKKLYTSFEREKNSEMLDQLDGPLDEILLALLDENYDNKKLIVAATESLQELLTKISSSQLENRGLLLAQIEAIRAQMLRPIVVEVIRDAASDPPHSIETAGEFIENKLKEMNEQL